MSNLSVTRFPGGVGDRAPGHPMFNLPVLDPTRYVTFFDDFTSLTLGASGVSGWHLAESGTSVGALDITDAHGGVAAFEPDDVNTEHQLWQWAVNTDPVELFLMDAAKAAWFRARLKTEAVAQNIPVIGLGNPQDDPWGTVHTDSFRFETLRADPDALRFVIGATAATQNVISLGNLTDDTWVTVSAYYNPVKNAVYAWTENDEGTILARGSQEAPDIPNATLGVHFGAETIGTAGANVNSVDYIFAMMER